MFALLNPIPFGFFVAALIFDAIYVGSTNVLWVKSAAWLNAVGLIFAIIPRLINLVHVWIPASRSVRVEKLDFWLNLVAIVAAIVNAFVHSRDAYGVMPEGVWLSAVTVALIAIGFVISAWNQTAAQGGRHA
ncbi:hypothetical protein [Achromobacter xylosoxidans]|uniref:hypothetical protein n=1 Tax=Alcaligenes xylosoxydans xylosoxydans TaxID=85698 RepID=UPI002958581C|nr:hypothetical protein [Achromobacter xylosoxidans]